MAEKQKAAIAKAKGNSAFQEKKFEEAIKHFTEAISHDDTDHVFFSNRSACYASIEKYEEALEDGTKCVSIKPDWPKGYTRKGLAEYFLQKYDDALETYKTGLKLSPEDATLKEGLKKASDAKYEVPGARPGGGSGGAGGGPGLSFDPTMLAGMAASNPKIGEYMKDAELMQKVQMISQVGATNQQMQQQLLMQQMQQDPRVLEIFMAMQGMAMPSDMEGPGASASAAPAKKEAPKKEEKKEEAPPDLRPDNQKEADEFKTKGNALYKEKKKLDPDNQECKTGRDQVLAQISASSSGAVDEEQVRHAMADPEIQTILHDPQIKMFLKEMQENPKEAQKAMNSDSKLMEAVSKLIAAGIIRTG